MTTIDVLEKIKNIYRLRYDAAIAKVAVLEKDFFEAKTQLDEILSYFNEYCDFFKIQAGNGLTGYQLKNQYQFINQFTPVISQQKNIIDQIYHKISNEKIALFTCYKDLKGLEQLLDKKNTVLKNLKFKQEIVEEESFINIHINKK